MAFGYTLLAQSIDNNKLEQHISVALKKAYPACVQLFAYDTVAKQQAGGVFSGVVITKDGYILTAAHVTTPKQVYKVNFPDGKSCLAVGLGKIVLDDDKTIPDAAVIKIISAGSWPFVELAGSASIKQFEPCISLSYPESLAQPVPILRFGYVSEVKNSRGFIKSTCLMEPGDSGGPLFDYMGRLIGLHSAIEVPEESNYDVPVDVYKKYWTALKLPKVYTAYPELTDRVPADSLSTSIIALPALKDKKAFVKAASALPSSCLVVESNIHGELQKVNGTLFSLVSPDKEKGLNRNFIINKSSLVGTEPLIVCSDHRKVTAKIIARDKENDLVLLQPEVEIAGGISYPQLTKAKLGQVQAGTFLVSPQQDTAGVISMTGSGVFNLNKMANSGFLGVGFKNRGIPLKISYVFPHLNKSIYELKTGDEIWGINDVNAGDFGSLMKELGRFWPGDTIKLNIKRGDTLLTKAIMLDTLPQRHFNHPAEMFAGGKSIRRDGFKAVFTHDAVIRPDKCGGPVFDLNDNFYGINIARYSRASCLAVPVTVLCDFINRSFASQVITGTP